MSPRSPRPSRVRVLPQLRHDHRTLAMLLVAAVPDPGAAALDATTTCRSSSTGSGPALLALIPFIVMFLVTSVTTLRERSSGTLERLLAMPTGKLDLLLGYALAFGLMATLQSTLAVALCVGLLGLDVAGPASGCWSWSRSPTPCSARRSGSSSPPSPGPSSRPSSSCRRSCSRRSCCAACSCRATSCRPVLEVARRPAAAVLRRRRDDRGASRTAAGVQLRGRRRTSLVVARVHRRAAGPRCGHPAAAYGVAWLPVRQASPSRRRCPCSGSPC